MTDQEIIQLLENTGHLGWPLGSASGMVLTDIGCRSLGQPAVARAVASYQDFMLPDLDRFCLKHHGRPAHADGKPGPATYELFAQPRCGCPDYGPNVAAATGNGSWAGCHGVGGYHAAKIHVYRENMPGFLVPHWEEVLERAIASFAKIGLRFIRAERPGAANITVTFETRSRGWIGLAIVGSNQSCGTTIWAKFLATYQPKDTVEMWTELVMHELGHNAGLQHSRGGIMNPSIIYGLPATWIGDPSEPILNRMYGGEPVPGSAPPTPEPPSGIVGRLEMSDGKAYHVTPVPEVPS